MRFLEAKECCKDKETAARNLCGCEGCYELDTLSDGEGLSLLEDGAVYTTQKKGSSGELLVIFFPEEDDL